MSHQAEESAILKKDNPILRKVALPVPVDVIGSEKIQSIILKMKAALHKEEDGVAIAAPQIGESLRIFVVNSEILSTAENHGPDENLEVEVTEKDLADLVFINPEITKLSRKKSKMEEGCLSVRWLYGQVLRSEKATVRAYDENGKKFEKGASGLLAQIFQHEIDHLDGILFIDKAENVEDIPPTKNNAVKL